MKDRQKLIEEITIHDEHNIKGFFGPYKWLSNFEPCNIYYRGLWFKNTEAAYMSAKTTDPEIAKQFCELNGPDARKLGRTIGIIPCWDDVRLRVMYEVNLQKYMIPKFKQLLFETGNKHIEETNWWNDKFWGVYFDEGANNLGKIIMYIRKGIQEGYL